MSDDVKHGEDDLDLSGVGTGADDVSTDEGGEAPSIEEDDEGADASSQLSPAEKAAQQQAENLAAKIKAGKLTLEKLESSDQKWLTPNVKALLGVTDEGAKATNEDVRSIAQAEVKQMIEAEKAKDAFKSLEASINTLPLTGEEKSLLKSEYMEIKKHAYDIKALEKAIKLAGIDLEGHERRFNAMEVPRAGSAFKKTPGKNESLLNQANMTTDKVREMLLKRKGL